MERDVDGRLKGQVQNDGDDAFGDHLAQVWGDLQASLFAVLEHEIDQRDKDLSELQEVSKDVIRKGGIGYNELKLTLILKAE